MIHQITINDFFNDQKDFTVIDVRSEIEFSVGHIKGALNIPYTQGLLMLVHGSCRRPVCQNF